MISEGLLHNDTLEVFRVSIGLVETWLTEWRFYALSASKAIFRARTYSRITYNSDDEYLMNETRRKPTTGTPYPFLLDL